MSFIKILHHRGRVLLLSFCCHSFIYLLYSITSINPQQTPKCFTSFGHILLQFALFCPNISLSGLRRIQHRIILRSLVSVRPFTVSYLDPFDGLSSYPFQHLKTQQTLAFNRLRYTLQYHNYARHLFHMSWHRTFTIEIVTVLSTVGVSIISSNGASPHRVTYASQLHIVSVIFLAANIKQSEQYWTVKT